MTIDKKIFSCFAACFLGVAFFSLILAIAGIFYDFLIIGYFFLVSVFFIYHFSRKNNQIKLKDIDKTFVLVAFLTLIAIFVFSFYTVPTIFSGRDQGSLSEAAIRLAENHKLPFSTPASEEFFKIYGPGKALNFPGFSYTENGQLITQFPPGYVSWMAVFYSLFGLSGFIIANAISFFIFSLSFYSLSELYTQKRIALAAFLLMLTSFVFSWFFKFTLSENLALALLWFSLWQFSLFLKSKQKEALFLSFSSILLLTFVRIEAVFFLAIMLFILAYRTKNVREFFGSMLKDKKNALVFALVFLFHVAYLLVNKHFYLNLAKGIISSFINLSPQEGESVDSFFSVFYVLEIFFAYALAVYVTLALIAFFHFLYRKKYSSLIPFFIVLPSFFYLIHPSISIDHPWMLRRFLFSVIPISIFYAVWYLDAVFRKKILLYISIFFLFFANLLVFIPYLNVREHENLLEETKILSENFGDNDLILIDRLATADGWAMISGPMATLFQKQAVYFFNPKDAERIDMQKFSHVYLIIPDVSVSLYKDATFFEKMKPVKDYTIKDSALTVQEENKKNIRLFSIELPYRQETITYGKIYEMR